MVSDVRRNANFTIQCDWNFIINNSDGKFWITSKAFDDKGIHGTVTVKDSLINASHGFGARFENNHLIVSHKDSHHQCTFIPPFNTFTNIHQKSILCVDVSSGGIGVSVCSGNKLLIWDASTGVLRRNLKGHLLDPYVCKFFPSGEVVLSSGADMQIKIWSAVTGECPVTMRGHTSAILDAAIVDRGRNIISVSKDGSAKLWDCGRASCIETVFKIPNGIGINTCALYKVDESYGLGVRNNPINDRANGTVNKLLVIGCENGNLFGIGLNSHEKIFQLNNDSAINTCQFISQYQILFGTHSGVINLIDIRQSSQIITQWKDSASSVLSLLPYSVNKKRGFFVSRSDGTCVYYLLDKDNETYQLTGPDFEPVYKISTDGDYIYTACRDGKIRKYSVNLSS